MINRTTPANGGHKPATAPAARMSIASITRGRMIQPGRILGHGPEGVGKSTFASNAPSTVFLCAEDGTANLDVARLPEPRTWEEVFEALRVLQIERHDFKTLAVDTLDWLEPLCWKHVCEAATTAQKKFDSIESFGFGKGYVAALDEWRRFLAALDALRKNRGMWVILLAHSSVRTFKNPEGDDYDRWQLKLNDKAGGLIKEWCDAVLFMRYDTYTYKESEKAKAKATAGVSSRSIYTVRTAAYDAKSRYAIPDKLPLSWEDFYSAVEKQQPGDPKALVAEISGLIDALDGAPADLFNREAFAKVFSAASDNASQLAILVDRLKGKVAQYEEAKAAVAPPATTTTAPAPAEAVSASTDNDNKGA